MKTPDLDPEEVRRALESPEWKQRPLVRPVEVIGDAAHEWLRLREQPAPDVQAQIDAAVAREREEIETRLCEVASLYPQRSGRRYALLQQVEWIRSRARSGLQGSERNEAEVDDVVRRLNDVQAQIDAGVAKEREACAEICSRFGSVDCADEIRARSAKGES